MEMTVHTERRVVQVEGAYNVRDLGGYRTRNGQITRWGVLYRADGLHRLTEESQQALIDKGIRTVIDLRGSREVEQKRNVLRDSDRVRYHNVSLLNPAAPRNAQMNHLGDLYVHLIDHAQVELRRVFSLLAEQNGHAALFHCAAGKDRTGVVAALLLELAGVPHETIAEDYALTASCIVPIIDELRSDRPAGVPAEVYETMLACDPAHMRHMLSHLESQYGGSERYLQAIGVPDAALQALKDRFTMEI